MSVGQLSAAGSLDEVPLHLPRAKEYVHGKVKVSARGFVAYSLEDLEAFALTFCPSSIGDTFLDTLLSTSSWFRLFHAWLSQGKLLVVGPQRWEEDGRRSCPCPYTAGLVSSLWSSVGFYVRCSLPWVCPSLWPCSLLWHCSILRACSLLCGLLHAYMLHVSF